MKIKISAIRKANYTDLQEKYENKIEHTCDISEGQVFLQMDIPGQMDFVTVHGKPFIHFQNALQMAKKIFMMGGCKIKNPQCLVATTDSDLLVFI